MENENDTTYGVPALELIPSFILYRMPAPDIQKLQEQRDIPTLTRLLQYPDFSVQWKAAEALGKLGPGAVDYLIHALTEHDLAGKLGSVEALADIKDKRALIPLINLLKYDESNEVRWASALALGELGDPFAVPPLREMLMNRDKYVRHGCAVALRRIGWEPLTTDDKIWNHIAFQEWDRIVGFGSAATEPLILAAGDPDEAVRYHAIEILGRMHIALPREACGHILQDGSAAIRWKAVQTAKKCRVPDPCLPWAFSKRVRNRKNPEVAALMNFLFLGLGYNYLGKWWGFLFFQIYMTTLLMFTLWPLSFLDTWVFLIFLKIPGIPILFPVSLVFAFHAWIMARKMPDL